MSSHSNHSSSSSEDALKPGELSALILVFKVSPNQTVSLKDFHGNPLILAFYPADFSPVCGDEMSLYNEILPEFQRFGAEILGISVDGVWCHLAFAKARNLHFPLLSDFEPKGEVAQNYGVYNKKEGICERALFVINKDGIIHWELYFSSSNDTSVAGILKALESLDTKNINNTQSIQKKQEQQQNKVINEK